MKVKIQRRSVKYTLLPVQPGTYWNCTTWAIENISHCCKLSPHESQPLLSSSLPISVLWKDSAPPLATHSLPPAAQISLCPASPSFRLLQSHVNPREHHLNSFPGISISLFPHCLEEYSRQLTFLNTDSAAEFFLNNYNQNYIFDLWKAMWEKSSESCESPKILSGSQEVTFISWCPYNIPLIKIKRKKNP